MKKKIVLLKFTLSLVFVVLLTDLFYKNSLSVEPEEILTNQKQELRARNISKKIRCLVCQNQSIDESASTLAKDMRILIRNKIQFG